MSQMKSRVKGGEWCNIPVLIAAKGAIACGRGVDLESLCETKGWVVWFNLAQGGGLVHYYDILNISIERI